MINFLIHVRFMIMQVCLNRLQRKATRMHLRLLFQICGREALEKTTLKSLGLNSGKAIIRLMYRDPKQFKTQAHVSTPLLPKPVLAVDNSSKNKDPQKVPLPTPHCSKITDDMILSTNIVPNRESQSKPRNETNMDTNIDEMKMDVTRSNVNADEEKMDVENEQANMKNECESQEMDTSMIAETYSVKDHDTEKGQNIMDTCNRIQEDTYKIEFVRCNCAYMQSRSSNVFAF